MSKIIASREAAGLVKDGSTIAISGFGGGTAFPEELCVRIEEAFLGTGHPRDLTLMMASGNGDGTKNDVGLNHFAHPEMVKLVIAGHVGLAQRLSGLINENKIAAYNFPQGVMTHLFRAIGGGKVGVVTHVGLQTFADPRVEGGKMNAAAEEDLVELVRLGDKERLLYKSRPVHVALIRGTTADEFGNLSMEKEALLTEALQIAQAARNSGGVVIAQVERVVKRGSLNPMLVRVPGILVDHVVIAEKKYHQMNFFVEYNPAYSGETKIPTGAIEPMPMSERKIIAKRCALELRPDTVINLGIGVPDGVAAVALEEGVSDRIYMTIEAGVIGGVPAPGLSIGASTNAEAIITHPTIFDFYDGGGIDLAFLGLAQADRNGNINVSKFSGRMVGCGGFVNITQNAKKVVFCGTFTAGKAEYEIRGNRLEIGKDGES
jgi:propionate CoA-transferase